MFCFQCQETAKNQGCTVRGVCGKPEETANLQDLLIHVLKGIAIYGEKAAELGISNRENGLFAAQALFTTITNANWDNDRFFTLIREALASTTKDLSVDEMVGRVMRAGDVAVNTMAALDEANTTGCGHPEITEVSIGPGTNPGILISGHDLKDMEELLRQTEGTDVDVYTHGEMLPANYFIRPLKNTAISPATTAVSGGTRTMSSRPLTARSS